MKNNTQIVHKAFPENYIKAHAKSTRGDIFESYRAALENEKQLFLSNKKNEITQTEADFKREKVQICINDDVQYTDSINTIQNLKYLTNEQKEYIVMQHQGIFADMTNYVNGRIDNEGKGIPGTEDDLAIGSTALTTHNIAQNAINKLEIKLNEEQQVIGVKYTRERTLSIMPQSRVPDVMESPTVNFDILTISAEQNLINLKGDKLTPNTSPQVLITANCEKMQEFRDKILTVDMRKRLDLHLPNATEQDLQTALLLEDITPTKPFSYAQFVKDCTPKLLKQLLINDDIMHHIGINKFCLMQDTANGLNFIQHCFLERPDLFELMVNAKTNLINDALNAKYETSKYIMIQYSVSTLSDIITKKQQQHDQEGLAKIRQSLNILEHSSIGMIQDIKKTMMDLAPARATGEKMFQEEMSFQNQQYSSAIHKGVMKKYQESLAKKTFEDEIKADQEVSQNLIKRGELAAKTLQKEEMDITQRQVQELEAQSVGVYKRCLMTIIGGGLEVNRNNMHDAHGKKALGAQNGLPASSYLSHGARIVVSIPAGSGNTFFNWLTSGDPSIRGVRSAWNQAGAIAQYVEDPKKKGVCYQRLTATHDIDISPQGQVIELKGLSIGARDLAYNMLGVGQTKHYGVDLAMGVDPQSNLDFLGIPTKIPDGRHGHIYIHYTPPTLNQPGAIMFGIEGASPNSHQHSKIGSSDPIAPSGNSLYEDLAKKKRTDKQYTQTVIPNKYNGQKIELSVQNLEKLILLDDTLYSTELAAMHPSQNPEKLLMLSKERGGKYSEQYAEIFTTFTVNNEDICYTYKIIVTPDMTLGDLKDRIKQIMGLQPQDALEVSITTPQQLAQQQDVDSYKIWNQLVHTQAQNLNDTLDTQKNLNTSQSSKTAQKNIQIIECSCTILPQIIYLFQGQQQMVGFQYIPGVTKFKEFKDSLILKLIELKGNLLDQQLAAQTYKRGKHDYDIKFTGPLQWLNNIDNNTLLSTIVNSKLPINKIDAEHMEYELFHKLSEDLQHLDKSHQNLALQIKQGMQNSFISMKEIREKIMHTSSIPERMTLLVGDINTMFNKIYNNRLPEALNISLQKLKQEIQQDNTLEKQERLNTEGITLKYEQLLQGVIKSFKENAMQGTVSSHIITWQYESKDKTPRTPRALILAIEKWEQNFLDLAKETILNKESKKIAFEK